MVCLFAAKRSLRRLYFFLREITWGVGEISLRLTVE